MAVLYCMVIDNSHLFFKLRLTDDRDLPFGGDAAPTTSEVSKLLSFFICPHS